jgi:toxin FitB
VTRYLLDTNVLREVWTGGHKNVQAWLSTVDAVGFYVSVLTVYEIRRGIVALARRDQERADKLHTVLNAFLVGQRDRIIPIDEAIADEWAWLVGTKDKHRDDMALAATARVRGFVLVTRNVADFRGRGVRVLDPFKAKPVVEEV